MSKGVKIMVIILVIVGVAYFGLCIMANVAPTSKSETLKIPSTKDVPYSVVIQNNGLTMLTAKFEQMGSVVGRRVFVLYGHWDLAGTEFIYKSDTLPLDEAVLGIIDVRKR